MKHSDFWLLFLVGFIALCGSAMAFSNTVTPRIVGSSAVASLVLTIGGLTLIESAKK